MKSLLAFLAFIVLLNVERSDSAPPNGSLRFLLRLQYWQARRTFSKFSANLGEIRIIIFTLRRTIGKLKVDVPASGATEVQAAIETITTMKKEYKVYFSELLNFDSPRVISVDTLSTELAGFSESFTALTTVDLGFTAEQLTAIAPKFTGGTSKYITDITVLQSVFASSFEVCGSMLTGMSEFKTQDEIAVSVNVQLQTVMTTLEESLRITTAIERASSASLLQMTKSMTAMVRIIFKQTTIYKEMTSVLRLMTTTMRKVGIDIPPNKDAQTAIIELNIALQQIVADKKHLTALLNGASALTEDLTATQSRLATIATTITTAMESLSTFGFQDDVTVVAAFNAIETAYEATGSSRYMRSFGTLTNVLTSCTTLFETTVTMMSEGKTLELILESVTVIITEITTTIELNIIETAELFFNMTISIPGTDVEYIEVTYIFAEEGYSCDMACSEIDLECNFNMFTGWYVDGAAVRELMVDMALPNALECTGHRNSAPMTQEFHPVWFENSNVCEGWNVTGEVLPTCDAVPDANRRRRAVPEPAESSAEEDPQAASGDLSDESVHDPEIPTPRRLCQCMNSEAALAVIPPLPVEMGDATFVFAEAGIDCTDACVELSMTCNFDDFNTTYTEEDIISVIQQSGIEFADECIADAVTAELNADNHPYWEFDRNICDGYSVNEVNPACESTSHAKRVELGDGDTYRRICRCV